MAMDEHQRHVKGKVKKMAMSSFLSMGLAVLMSACAAVSPTPAVNTARAAQPVTATVAAVSTAKPKASLPAASAKVTATPAPTVQPKPTAAAALTAKEQTAYVSAKRVNVRAAADSNTKVLAQLKQRSPVTILEAGKPWSKIKTTDGKIGYVATSAVTVTQRAPKASDWSNINPNMPKVLYEYDYNVNLGLQYGGENWFETNKDFSAMLDKTFERTNDPFHSIEALLKAGSEYVGWGDTVDFRTIGNEYRNKLLYYYSTGGNGDKEVDAWIDRVKRDKIVSEVRFVTDRSLAYHGSNGANVIRGRKYIRYDISSGEAFLKGRGVEANVWYYQDIEVSFTGIVGNSRWEHGSFGIQRTTRLSDMLVAPLNEVEGFSK